MDYWSSKIQQVIIMPVWTRPSRSSSPSLNNEALLWLLSYIFVRQQVTNEDDAPRYVPSFPKRADKPLPVMFFSLDNSVNFLYRFLQRHNLRLLGPNAQTKPHPTMCHLLLWCFLNKRSLGPPRYGYDCILCTPYNSPTITTTTPGLWYNLNQIELTWIKKLESSCI